LEPQASPSQIEVASQEALARFVFSRSHFEYKPGLRVKHNAFMPMVHNSEHQTSVFRVSELEEAEIWAIGRDVEKVRQQTLHGRADFKASDVSAAHLRVRPDEPPPRHSVIFDWPSDKDEQIAIALELAGMSTAVLAT
jgi:hypothetical protein